MKKRVERIYWSHQTSAVRLRDFAIHFQQLATSRPAHLGGPRWAGPKQTAAHLNSGPRAHHQLAPRRGRDPKSWPEKPRHGPPTPAAIHCPDQLSIRRPAEQEIIELIRKTAAGQAPVQLQVYM